MYDSSDPRARAAEQRNHSVNLDPNILRKIRKCLALAESSVPGEAEAAMRQAQKLMAAHGVDADSLDRSAIEKAYTRGITGQRPPNWENRLVWTCCQAFGGHPLWAAGPRGGTTKWDNGVWLFLAEGQRAELIKYAYEVLCRQVLKARARRSAEHHIGMTRPAKAAFLDDYCEAYVERLAEKVSPYALDARAQKALEGAKNAITDPTRPPAETRAGAGSYAARAAGYADGADAQFHAAARGPEAQLKLEGEKQK